MIIPLGNLKYLEPATKEFISGIWFVPVPTFRVDAVPRVKAVIAAVN